MSRGSLIKSIAQAKAHLFTLCEACKINDDEMDFLYSRGWQFIRNKDGDLLVGCRTNRVGSTMVQLVSTLVGVAHQHLPCSHMIVEIKCGKILPAGQSGNRGDFADASLTAPLTRAGSSSIRVCVFHLDRGVAGDHDVHRLLALSGGSCRRSC